MSGGHPGIEGLLFKVGSGYAVPVLAGYVLLLPVFAGGRLGYGVTEQVKGGCKVVGAFT